MKDETRVKLAQLLALSKQLDNMRMPDLNRAQAYSDFPLFLQHITRSSEIEEIDPSIYFFDYTPDAMDITSEVTDYLKTYFIPRFSYVAESRLNRQRALTCVGDSVTTLIDWHHSLKSTETHLKGISSLKSTYSSSQLDFDQMAKIIDVPYFTNAFVETAENNEHPISTRSLALGWARLISTFGIKKLNIDLDITPYKERAQKIAEATENTDLASEAAKFIIRP